jgi:hypothetical protein
MIKPTDFGEIILVETDDYQLFSRKKLIKTYNKYKDIRTAFKHNKLQWCFDGEITRHILTKQELNLILQEIVDYAYKYTSKQESRYVLLKYYHDQLTECVLGMKELIDNLPEKDKTTHYDCECGSKVFISNKARHLNSPLHLNFINKVEPKAKAERVVQCGCGKKYTTNNKTHHDKTQHHVKWNDSKKESI